MNKISIEINVMVGIRSCAIVFWVFENSMYLSNCVEIIIRNEGRIKRLTNANDSIGKLIVID